jgi:hypothetical protein
MTKIAVKMEVNKLKYKMERARRSVGSGSAASAPVGRLPGVALGSLTFPPTLNMRIPENKKTGMVYSLRKQIRTMIEDEKKTLTSINAFLKVFSCFSMKSRSYFCAARRKSAKNSVRPSLRFPGGDRGIESNFSSEGFSKLETENRSGEKGEGSIGRTLLGWWLFVPWCVTRAGEGFGGEFVLDGGRGTKEIKTERRGVGGRRARATIYLANLVRSDLRCAPPIPASN